MEQQGENTPTYGEILADMNKNRMESSVCVCDVTPGAAGSPLWKTTKALRLVIHGLMEERANMCINTTDASSACMQSGLFRFRSVVLRICEMVRESRTLSR